MGIESRRKLALILTRTFAIGLQVLTWVLLPLLILLSIGVAMIYTFTKVLIVGSARLLGLGKQRS